MDIRVHKFMNMYVHVCTMFKHVYTVLPYPVQGGRIPDGEFAPVSESSDAIGIPFFFKFRVKFETDDCTQEAFWESVQVPSSGELHMAS